MVKLFILVSLSTLVFSQLKADANTSKQETPAFSGSIQSTESVSDSDLLKGFSPITFLLNISSGSLEASKKLQHQAIEELKKIGQVTLKKVSIQHLMEDKVLLKSPSLTFRVTNIQDLKGHALPILQVSLKCEAFLEVANNKHYGHGSLWGKECFLQADPNVSLEEVLSETLPLLLQKFQDAYLNANGKDAPKITFLFIE